MNKGTSDTSPTVLNVKNGSIELSGSDGFAHFNQSSPQIERTITFNVSDVKFKLLDGAFMKSFVTASALSKKIYANCIFVDCDFDIGSNAGAGGFVAFDAGDADGYLVTAVTISGGNLSVDNAEDIVLYSVNNNLSSAVFNKNTNGEYMTVSMPDSNTAPWFAANTDSGVWAYNTAINTVNGITNWEIGFDTKLGFTSNGAALSNASGGACKFVVASYSESILLDVALIDISADTTLYSNSFESIGLKTDGATKVKIMLMDSTDNIKPLCCYEEK